LWKEPAPRALPAGNPLCIHAGTNLDYGFFEKTFAEYYLKTKLVAIA
jgi:hypothetical protein